MAEKTAKARYEALRLKREQYLQRARDYAEISVPSIMPPLGFNGTQRLPEPYQGLNARCVMSLSSRILSAMLPAGVNFFKLAIPAASLVQQGTQDVPADVSQGLAKSELLIQSEVERRGWRAPTSVALQHLIVTGNYLEQTLPDNTLQGFRLDQYVVARDTQGNLIEIVVLQLVSPLALPEQAKSLVPQKDQDDPECSVELYTWIVKAPDGSFHVCQQVNGQKVPGSEGKYKPNQLPFRALRWSIVAGEDYGRSKCEEHAGDMRSFDALSKAMLDGAAMAARNITIVKPNATGTNLKTKLAKANNGDVIVGDPEAIKMLQFENVNGLQIVQQELQRLEKALGQGFILNSSVQRDAERVTAYEVRMVAEELENILGGTYSLLASEMQQPRVERLIIQMHDQKALPVWDDKQVAPQVTTGLEALSREKDVQRVQAAAELASKLDPKQEYIKTGDLLKVALNGLGLPAVVRTDQEVMQNRQKQAQIDAMSQGGGVAPGGAPTAPQAPQAPPQQAGA